MPSRKDQGSGRVEARCIQIEILFSTFSLNTFSLSWKIHIISNHNRWAFSYSWKCLSTISNLGTFYNSLRILIHIVDTRRSLNTFSCSWKISTHIVSTRDSLERFCLSRKFSTCIVSTQSRLGTFSSRKKSQFV